VKPKLPVTQERGGRYCMKKIFKVHHDAHKLFEHNKKNDEGVMKEEGMFCMMENVHHVMCHWFKISWHEKKDIQVVIQLHRKFENVQK
jgi:hypothetical protein